VDRFRVLGGSRLQGVVTPSGAKNAALPALAATLLASQPVVLDRVPAVRDVRTMLRLLEHLGVGSRGAEGAMELFPTGATALDAPYDLVKTMRAGVLVLGPLVARHGEAKVSLPGGCAIGQRPIDQHLLGLEALGAEIELEHGYVLARVPGGRLRGAPFRFAQPTVTGTENLLMAATLARGTTVLDNCAREPEVVDLARLLTALGARIEGAGSDRITVEGVEALAAGDSGGARHRVIADRIEGGTYLVAAVLTGGDVELVDCDPAALRPLLDLLRQIGAEVAETATSVRVRRSPGARLSAAHVETAPHPGFPTDLQAQAMVLLTQADGVSTVVETVFENRFQHAAELRRMGADVRTEGNRAAIHGPTALSGATVMATDLRASACLVLAGLAAQGETIVDRIYHLDRGYEAMESKLQALGGVVERISGGTVA
jgi:UDP-N-acetylglucosamine 1-carboxyvinyltransferase